MSNIDMNVVIQSIIMIMYLFLFVLVTYVLWLLIRALKKYLKEE
jgi:hypothetical protein